ncbi:MAG: FliM/FliN family flagellar motor switch protein [Parvularculaceae bacterium]
MAPLDKIEVELTVLVGEAEMPLQRLLRLSRGAVIKLGGDERRPLTILANGRPIAEGRVSLRGEKVAVEITGDDGENRNEAEAA